jgi:hypothetical protein
LHALDQAWRSRAGQALTLADYERTGGIEGAVAASAQRAYDRLTSGQQAAARQVFTRLTATSAEGVDSADRATKAELTEGKSPAEAQDVAAVLEAFAAERLLTLAAGTVELSHEALLTAWPLLRDTWLADTHADRIARTRLHATAAGSAPTRPATRRSARPNVTSCTPAATPTGGPCVGGRGSSLCSWPWSSAWPRSRPSPSSPARTPCTTPPPPATSMPSPCPASSPPKASTSMAPIR